MCRKISEGGRRCPSNRGARRRAAARARYAARRNEAEFAAGFSVRPITGSTDLSGLSHDQLIAVRDEARTEAVAARARVREIAESLDLDGMVGGFHMQLHGDEMREVIGELQKRRHDGDDTPLTCRGVELTADDADDVVAALERAYTREVSRLGAAVTLAGYAEAEREFAEKGTRAGGEEDYLAAQIARAGAVKERIDAALLDPDVVAVLDKARAHIDAGEHKAECGTIDDLREVFRPMLGDDVDDPDTDIGRAFHTACQRGVLHDKGGIVNARDVNAIYRYLEFDAAADLKSATKATPDHLSRDRVMRRRELVRAEIMGMRSFGEQRWDDIKIISRGREWSADEMRAATGKALSHFPDAMVADLKKTRPSLVVKYSKKRAFFTESALVPQRRTYLRTYSPSSLDSGPDTGYDFPATNNFYDGRELDVFQAQDATYPLDDLERVRGWCERNNDGSIDGGAWSGRRGRRGKRTKVTAKIIDTAVGQRVAIVPVNTPTYTGRTTAPLMTTGGSPGTTIHEFSHAMEHSPHINVAARRFLADRTVGCDTTVYGKGPDGETELVAADGFFSSYVGKQYPGVHTEVFSMGMEHVMNAGSLIDAWDESGSADPGHRDLIFGILAGYPDRD